MYVEIDALKVSNFDIGAAGCGDRYRSDLKRIPSLRASVLLALDDPQLVVAIDGDVAQAVQHDGSTRRDRVHRDLAVRGRVEQNGDRAGTGTAPLSRQRTRDRSAKVHRCSGSNLSSQRTPIGTRVEKSV